MYHVNFLLVIFCIVYIDANALPGDEDSKTIQEVENNQADDSLMFNNERDSRVGSERQLQQWQISMMMPPGVHQPHLSPSNSIMSNPYRYFPFHHEGYPPEIFYNMANNARYAPHSHPSTSIKMNEHADEPATPGSIEPTSTEVIIGSSEDPLPATTPAEITTTTEVNIETTTIPANLTDEESGGNVHNVVVAPSFPVNAKPNRQGLLRYCIKKRGQFPYPDNCRVFVNCWDGFAALQQCGTGLVFSTKGYCDWKINVDCEGRKLQAESVCEMPNGIYKDAKNCSQYFMCERGRPILFSCPEGLVFNDEYKVCDYNFRVGCYNKVEDLNSISKDEIPPENSRCIANSVMRISEDCSKVSVCSKQGTSKVVTCPSGMGYDIRSSRCVQRDRARC